jgi:hypothetical protein
MDSTNKTKKTESANETKKTEFTNETKKTDSTNETKKTDSTNDTKKTEFTNDTKKVRFMQKVFFMNAYRGMVYQFFKATTLPTPISPVSSVVDGDDTTTQTTPTGCN